MNIPDWQVMVLNLVSLAKEQLSLARLLKQRAQVIRDMKDVFGIRPSDPELIPTLLNAAWISRCQAGATLKKIEIENGKMVTQGIDPIRLTRYLDGRNYPTWQEYSDVYQSDLHLKEA